MSKYISVEWLKENEPMFESGADEVWFWVAINSAPSIEVPTWIPCSDRLPSDNREVLISCEWGIDIGAYERGEWKSEWINHYDDDEVLAWQPLPQSYRKDE